MPMARIEPRMMVTPIPLSVPPKPLLIRLTEPTTPLPRTRPSPRVVRNNASTGCILIFMISSIRTAMATARTIMKIPGVILPPSGN